VLIPSIIGGLIALALTLPLAWKWELGVARVARGVIVIAVVASALLALVDVADGVRVVLVAALTLLVAFAVLAYRFYRDPEREVPNRHDAIISPADGEVVYVRRSEGGKLPGATKKGRDYELVELTKTPLEADEAVVIGIGMSFLDVHVNRAPIAGQVRVRQHFPGRFGSLGRPEMVYENERATTIISRGDIEVAVVQIASRLVRQIASFVKPGEQVGLGQRIGVIRLGSQVDVVVPLRPGLEVNVAPGDRVWAGRTVLADLDAQQ
jgi:phosphatidylserine decarboxylase